MIKNGTKQKHFQDLYFSTKMLLKIFCFEKNSKKKSKNVFPNVLQNVSMYFSDYNLETIEEAFNSVFKLKSNKNKSENELTALTIKKLLASTTTPKKKVKSNTRKQQKISIEEMVDCVLN